MKVLYVDDEQRTLDAFTSDHAKDGMSIETCLDARQVVRMLARRPSKDLPDITVILLSPLPALPVKSRWRRGVSVAGVRGAVRR